MPAPARRLHEAGSCRQAMAVASPPVIAPFPRAAASHHRRRCCKSLGAALTLLFCWLHARSQAPIEVAALRAAPPACRYDAGARPPCAAAAALHVGASFERTVAIRARSEVLWSCVLTAGAVAFYVRPRRPQQSPNNPDLAVLCDGASYTRRHSSPPLLVLSVSRQPIACGSFALPRVL